MGIKWTMAIWVKTVGGRGVKTLGMGVGIEKNLINNDNKRHQNTCTHVKEHWGKPMKRSVVVTPLGRDTQANK
jgi:hypothetical protein